MKTSKKVIAICVLLILCVSLLFAACNKQRKPKSVENVGISHEDEFGGIYILKTIDQFNDLGYEYGDSVDITFSNGYEIKDIPYYNGYYTKNGEKLLVAYPGYPYIKVCINNGDDLYTIAHLLPSDKATIRINTIGKYLDVQKSRDLHYSDDRSQFDSDEKFANFRWVKAGNIKECTLFRSASPCDNQHKRASTVDGLISFAQINYIVDLADTYVKIEGYLKQSDFNSPYFKFLYDNTNVAPVGLNMNYESDEFKEKVAGGLVAMIQSGGPYLVHCTEGKDRTGFVCMLLEALCGATYQEIVDDYMITYDNYYGIKKGDYRYSIIVDSLLDPMIQSVVNDSSVDFKTVDLSPYAKNWLIAGEMSEHNVNKLIDYLTGPIVV